MSGTNLFPKYVKTTLGAAAAFAMGLSTSFACKSTVLDPNHCFNTVGDDKCAELYPDGSRPYCGVGTCFPEVDDGCVEARPETDDCYSPCGGRMSAEDDEDLSCVGGDAGSDTGTMSSGMTMDDDDDDDDDDDSTTTMGDDDDDDDSSSGDTGPTLCDNDEQCTEGNQLFCEDGMCVDCSGTPDGDAACDALDDGRPACTPDGQCVACTSDAFCDGTTPICDTDASTCRQCLAHSECPMGACKIPLGFGTNVEDWGACFDVEPTLADSMTVLSLIGNHDDGDLLIRLSDAEGPVNGSVTYNDNGYIAILPVDGEQPQWQRTIGTGSSLTITGQANVWLYDMRFDTNNDGGSAAIDVLDGAKLHVQRSRIVGNTGGGISATAGAFAIVENSFVGGADNPALDSSGSQFDIVYSTLTRTTNFGDPVVLCSDSGAVEGIRNSLIVNESNNAGLELSCDVVPDTSIVVTTQSPTDWMSGFDAGNYELTAPPMAWLTTAIWLDGDPATDIDGTPRPTEDGSEDVVGAHIP